LKEKRLIYTKQYSTALFHLVDVLYILANFLQSRIDVFYQLLLYDSFE